MKINSVDNKTNFGWKTPAHENITSIITNEFPKLKKYKDTLTTFVVKPDFDERGFKGNAHFYFTPELWHPRESFMDLTGSQNALAKYNEHIFQFDKYVNKNNEKAMEHAGRALHFLQDVTQPQHVQRGTIYQKWKDFDIHKDFETYEAKYHDYFMRTLLRTELDVKKNDFDDLFDEAVFLSESSKPATSKNKAEWGLIAMDGIANMMAATREFCQNISNALK